MPIPAWTPPQRASTGSQRRYEYRITCAAMTRGAMRAIPGAQSRHGTTTSRVLGGWILRYRVDARDLLFKRAAVLSPGGTGQWVRCQRSGRKTDQRPEIRKIASRGPPAGGAGSVNKVFTATYQLITINSAAPHECVRPIRTAGSHGGSLGSP